MYWSVISLGDPTNSNLAQDLTYILTPTPKFMTLVLTSHLLILHLHAKPCMMANTKHFQRTTIHELRGHSF
jgi:hypothetical protein